MLTTKLGNKFATISLILTAVGAVLNVFGAVADSKSQEQMIKAEVKEAMEQHSAENKEA